MDLNLLHIYMELTAAACLFFIAGINLFYNATGEYSKLMALGTSIAGTTDLLHVFVPVFYPNITEYWTMLSWTGSRITLTIMFLMVFLCYDVIRCRLINLAVILALPLMFLLFMAASQFVGIDSFYFDRPKMEIFGIVVQCRVDFTLLIIWFMVAILLRKKAHILFPPHVYWLFMSQGIMVHAIMSFASFNSLDIASLMAHSLKISEYYSFILIYLLYKSTLDRRSKSFRTTTTKSTSKSEIDYVTPTKL